MQASQIKLGEHYAVNIGGTTRDVRVTAMRTERTERDGTTNFIVGWTPAKVDGTPGDKVVVPVKDVIDTMGNHRELAEAAAARAAERKAIAERKAAKQLQAMTMLANAIGAQAVEDRYGTRTTSGGKSQRMWNQDAPAVILSGTSAIEINEHAFDGLIQLLARVTLRDVADVYLDNATHGE